MSVPIFPSSSGSAKGRGNRRLVLLLDREAAKQQRKGDREVERVNGSLVKYNRPVPVKVGLRLFHPTF